MAADSESDSQPSSESPPSPPASDDGSSNDSSSSSPPPPSSPPPSSPPPSSPPPSSPPPSSPPPPSPPPSSPSPSSPPPQSDNNQSSPPSPPPPPQSDKDLGSSFSPPPFSDKGGNQKSPGAPSPPPPSSSWSTLYYSPPPPSQHRLSPARPSSSNSPSDSSSLGEDDGAQLSVPGIIGVAVGAGLLLLIIILIVILCSRRKRSSDTRIYYAGHASHDDNYFTRTTAPNRPWNNGDHVLTIPPAPGAGAKPWGPRTPPGQMASGDLSNSSYNSGSQGTALPPPHPSVAPGFNQSTFTYEELSAATGGFAQVNLIGQGGFGYVHKGVLPNGKEVAVKTLKSTGGQADREFQAEVDIISRVHHRHLVSLVGYCFADGKRLLVYEFVPNKTFEYHLHGKGRPVMDWATRLKIAIGAAKGLAYLHEDCHPRIIHRDIKGPNILIDDNFEAKVADFGLAKFNQDANTHVSTRVMGTFGYLAPEYASSGKLTEKSDVFSFGVMLLELITGRPPVDTTGDYEEDSLAEWARPLCIKAMETGNFEGLVDPRLQNNYDKQEMARMVTCAASSVRHSAKRRSKMSQIVRALEGDVSLDDLSEGMKLGQSGMFNASGEYDASAYSADMKRFRKLALESGCTSSEFGGTSEYGLNPSASSDSSDYGRRTGSRMHTP